MTASSFTRRDLLKFTAAGAAVGTLGACATAGGSKGKVVVVGGGWGGATAAKYIRRWSDGSIDVTLEIPGAAVQGSLASIQGPSLGAQYLASPAALDADDCIRLLGLDRI